MVTTHDAGGGFDDIVSTSTLTADFRPQLDLPAPLPDRLVPPDPPANLVEFRIAGDPTLSLGDFVSGDGTDLTFDDANYYIARATGAPRTLAFEATSEVVDYATGTDITIEFTGRVDRAGITQQIFVHNPNDAEHTDGGYDTTPDIASVYSAKDTDQTVSFALSDADVAYFNSLSSSTKAIKIKVAATDPRLFRLSSDRLVYKVAGQPNPTFNRDYLVEGAPAVEAGDHITGDATSLQADDTNYYEVRDVGLVVQWTVVSEAINLDAISSIEVIFTGRAVNNTTTQGLYVFNPDHGGDGYDSTADLETTYSAIDTDETVSFFLNAADLTYVNSLFPKEVRLRLKGTHATSQFRIQADQIVFRSKP